ncbi:MAG: hypothetical protein HC859_06325 [Bacteroidia bacterium]|nr:hypothetical protein [Bacteroidia bacterium]
MEKPADRYKNILVIVIGLAIVGWIPSIPFSPEWRVIIWKAAVVIGLASLLSSTVAKAIEWGWLKLALGLGWVNSRIILGIVFFVFLTPIAWLARLFTRDPLQLKRNASGTLYHNRDHTYTKEDLENIW